MMLFFMLGLFVAKHGVLTHVVDFGYSAGRSPNNRFWRWGLLSQCLAEAAVSTYILASYHLDEVIWLLIAEQFALALSGVVERRTPVHKVLIAHVACEFGVLLVYVAMLVQLNYLR